MTTEMLTTAAEHAGDGEMRSRIIDVAIDEFGQHGFASPLSIIAEAAGVSAALVSGQFGSAEGLRKACDDHIQKSIRTAKSEALQSMSPANWFAQLAEIESYAPMMSYLVRSMLYGGDLGRALMQQLIDNAEEYLEGAVRAGTIKPSRDPKARAKFLGMTGGGGFLLYLNMHDNPTDMAAVLRDYGRDMLLPALEIYTHGLMTDANMYDAVLAREESG